MLWIWYWKRYWIWIIIMSLSINISLYNPSRVSYSIPRKLFEAPPRRTGVWWPQLPRDSKPTRHRTIFMMYDVYLYIIVHKLKQYIYFTSEVWWPLTGCLLSAIIWRSEYLLFFINNETMRHDTCPSAHLSAGIKMFDNIFHTTTLMNNVAMGNFLNNTLT